MSHSRLLKSLLLLCLAGAAVFVAACGQLHDTSSDSTSASTVSLADCTPDTMDTLKSGTLTIGTDYPAYPPVVQRQRPDQRQGLRVRGRLRHRRPARLRRRRGEWTVVPFNTSYKPGAKDFDFDINQISITPARAEVVDFSDGYYPAAQAVIALKDSGRRRDLDRRAGRLQPRRPDRHDVARPRSAT